MDFDQLYPCPCCGYQVHRYPPGYHEVCPICHWEDDLSQLRFAHMPGSANHVSLCEGQRNFKSIGAAERRHLAIVRAPLDEELQDSSWRPIDVAVDNIEEPSARVKYADSYPQDTTVLYYWLPTYWRRVVG